MIAHRELEASVPICREGEGEWRPAGEVLGVSLPTRAAEPFPVSESSNSPSSRGNQREAHLPGTPPKRKGHGVAATVIAVVAAASLALKITNRNHRSSSPPSADRAQFSAITTSYKSGNFEEALRQINHFLETHPQHDKAWTLKGRILLSLKRAPEAAKAFETALSINPKDVDALSGEGILARKRGDFEEAMRRYRRALEIDPHRPLTYSSMAVTELSRGNNAQALVYAKQAFDADPKEPVIAANLAVTYHCNGLKKERDEMTALAEKLGYQNVTGLYRIYTGEVVIGERE
jgi:Flp pilus assembly protein TadD